MQAALARPGYVSTAEVVFHMFSHTPRVCAAPEDYSSLLVRWVAEDFVQLHGKAVQVTDVERTEVAVEGIVQQRLVDAEVHRWERLSASNSGACLRPR